MKIFPQLSKFILIMGLLGLVTACGGHSHEEDEWPKKEGSDHAHSHNHG